jgi:proteasome lid subunit RPN8/RPN11
MPERGRSDAERFRVVAEERRPPRILPSPNGAAPHPWAKGPSAKARFYVEAAVAQRLAAMAQEGARHDLEVMGLLLGDYLVDPRGDPYSVALEVATAPLEASATHVRFDSGRMEELARSLEEQDFDYAIVGWFHSHLAMGCFLSPTDKVTQARYFRMPHQFALVIDPIRREASAFQLLEGAETPRPFAVFRDVGGAGGSYRRPWPGPEPTAKERLR